MQQATPRSQRNKRLHVVYFVDAARTKSLSVSLRALAFGGAGVLALFIAAGTSVFTAARLAAQVRASRDYVRELKRGVLAQSVAYERVLAKGATEGEMGELSSNARALESEIAANADAPVRSDDRGNKPLDLAKVTRRLSNLDTATLNLVAAGGDDGKAVPGASGTGAVEGADAESGIPASRGEGRAPAAEGPTGVSLSAKVQRAGAAPPPGTVAAGNTSRGGAALPAPGPAPGSGPTGVRGTAVPSTSARVTFDRVTLLAVTDVAPDAEGTAAEREVREDDGAAEESGPAPDAAEPTGSRLRFVLSNHTQPQVLMGRVCAVAVVVEPGTGAESVRTIPEGLELRGAGNAPAGCPGGQLVRFSRLRPTELALPVPPARVKSVTLHFSEGPGASLHSHAWVPVARPGATPGR